MNDEGKKQYIWLVRYGLTEYTLVEGVGPYDSDIDPTIGVAHANAIANCISTTSEDSVPTLVYTDPFMRCTHTGNIIAKVLGKENGKIHRIEEGLTEWQVPSLLVDADSNKTNPRTSEQLQELFPGTIDLSYNSVNPLVPDHTRREDVAKGSTLFPETESDLFERCAATITRVLDNLENYENICIVSHAPCNQAIALFLAGSAECIGKWSLGGITRFSRDVEKNGTVGRWHLDFYSMTKHMTGEYKDGVKGAWSLPSFIKR